MGPRKESGRAQKVLSAELWLILTSGLAYPAVKEFEHVRVQIEKTPAEYQSEERVSIKDKCVPA